MAITNKDIVKLKEVFVTKEDLKELSSQFVTTFATKQELRDKIRDVCDLVRQENRRMKKEIVSEISEFIGNSILPILDSHENRLLALEER